MSAFTEFYTKVMEHSDTKKELETILDGQRMEEIGDDKLRKIGAIAKRLGYEITLEEAKSYFQGDDVLLDEEDLDAVAGGKSYVHEFDDCDKGVGAIAITI